MRDTTTDTEIIQKLQELRELHFRSLENMAKALRSYEPFARIDRSTISRWFHKPTNRTSLAIRLLESRLEPPKVLRIKHPEICLIPSEIIFTPLPRHPFGIMKRLFDIEKVSTDEAYDIEIAIRTGNPRKDQNFHLVGSMGKLYGTQKSKFYQHCEPSVIDIWVSTQLHPANIRAYLFCLAEAISYLNKIRSREFLIRKIALVLDMPPKEVRRELRVVDYKLQLNPKVVLKIWESEAMKP